MARRPYLEGVFQSGIRPLLLGEILLNSKLRFLTTEVSEHLCDWAEGRESRGELEKYILGKLDQAALNLHKLKFAKHPESDCRNSFLLYSAFAHYGEGLMDLEDYLLDIPKAPEKRLEEIFRLLQQGDDCLRLIEGELEGRLAQLMGA